MARESWNGNPVKPGNWGTWAQIETPKLHIKPSCYTCSFCDSDGACRKTGAVISEVGSNAYKTCKFYNGVKPKQNSKNKPRMRPPETYRRFIVDENHHLVNNADYKLSIHELESVLLHQVVQHKTYGRGVIVSYKNRLVSIRFKKIRQVKKYRWPGSFIEGLIIPIGDKVKNELEYVKELNGIK